MSVSFQFQEPLSTLFTFWQIIGKFLILERKGEGGGGMEAEFFHIRNYNCEVDGMTVSFPFHFKILIVNMLLIICFFVCVCVIVCVCVCVCRS